MIELKIEMNEALALLTAVEHTITDIEWKTLNDTFDYLNALKDLKNKLNMEIYSYGEPSEVIPPFINF